MAEKENESKGFPRLLDSVKNKLGSLFSYLEENYFSLDNFIDIIKTGVGIIHDMDDALTDMQKVSHKSIQSLKAFQKESFNVADTVGTSALTLQSATADWIRLGEAMDDAADSAKASIILLNVSDFESLNDAAAALAAVNKVYSELEKIDIVDVINNIENNYQIAIDELAKGLQDTAAVLKSQGNDLNESVALLTAGNAITEDMSKTSTSVQTISLRLAGTKEAKAQLASLGEDVDDFIFRTQAKTQQLIQKYTAVASNAYKGVDVLDANGNLKNTYDILLDIAKVYKEIQEEDKKTGGNRSQALVETIAGKNQSNIASGILLNPQLLEDVYTSALDSAGSAQNELDDYLDSISGHLTKLQNQWQSIWVFDDNREFINFFIDLGTGILKVVDNLGILKTALIGIAAYAGINNVGSPKMFGLIICFEIPTVC